MEVVWVVLAILGCRSGRRSLVVVGSSACDGGSCVGDEMQLGNGMESLL
jgi:hypothetical protein